MHWYNPYKGWGKRQVGKHCFSFLFRLFGKLFAKFINHAFGYVEPAIGQIGKEFSAFVDGSAAIAIQQEEEGLDASAIIHLVHNAGGILRMNRSPVLEL